MSKNSESLLISVDASKIRIALNACCLRAITLIPFPLYSQYLFCHRYDGKNLYLLKKEAMSKEKEGKPSNNKKAAVKTLKEKRAAKAAKRNVKND